MSEDRAEVLRLRDVVRELRQKVTALESRASNAGGAVWIQRDHLEKAKMGAYLCRVEAEYRDGMGFVPLYPAPASKEPVADERAAFEAALGDELKADQGEFSLARACSDGRPYTFLATKWAWHAWQARAALATAQTPDGWQLVPMEPTLEMLAPIVHYKWPEDSEAGKAHQRKHGLWPIDTNPEAIPAKAEYEIAVGQYQRMLAAAPAKPEGV